MAVFTSAIANAHRDEPKVKAILDVRHPNFAKLRNLEQQTLMALRPEDEWVRPYISGSQA